MPVRAVCNPPVSARTISHTCAASILALLPLLPFGAHGQQATVPIRGVSAPTATVGPFRAVSGVIEIGGGKLLLDAQGNRTLLLYDAALAHPTILADTTGSVALYPRAAKLVRFLADSTLFVESDTRSLVMIHPDGTFGRVMAPPKPQDMNGLLSGGPVGADAMGRLIYQGPRPSRFQPACRIVDGVAVKPVAPLPASDSVAIVRADFDARTADTIARARVALAGLTFPISTTDANCRTTAAKVRVDPSVPSTDAWAVTSQGIIAIVRGHDYHVDWIDSSGSRRSTAKLPFDWRRLTDDDKRAKVDSARRIVDSLTSAGGYRMQACGNSMSFNTAPPNVDGGRGGGGGGGGGGGDSSSVSGTGRASVSGGSSGDTRPPSECQTLTVTAEYPAPSEMPDYIAPIRESSLRADRNGNLWILPTTSRGANGGLLFDVVNASGELVERVQLPADRDIIGFTRSGAIFLSNRQAPGQFMVERVTVVR